MTDPDLEDDVWADDGSVWSDDDEGRRGISPILIVAAALAILGVVAILVATRNTDDKTKTGGTDQSSAQGGRIGPDTAGGSTATTSKAKRRWPNDVLYRPTVFGKTGEPVNRDSSVAPGVYIWSDFDGWFLWVVDPSGKAAARGSVTSNDDIAAAKLGVQGSGTVDSQGRRITFDFSGVQGKSAGAVFNPGFYGSTLLIDLDGKDLPVFLGSKMVKTALPITIAQTVPG